MLNTIYHFPWSNGKSIPLSFFNEVAVIPSVQAIGGLR
jgi:hypothetical protein